MANLQVILRNTPSSIDLEDAMGVPSSCFGLKADAGFNPDGSFSGTDNSAAFKDIAESGLVVDILPGRYRHSDVARFSGATTRIRGLQKMRANNVTAGAWILRDNPAQPAFLIGGDYDNLLDTISPGTCIGSSIENLGFIEAHPVPSATAGTPWTPVDYAPCVQADNMYGAFFLDELFGLFVSKLVETRSCGHFEIGTLHGQCFRNMLSIFNCQDEPDLTTLRHWTYKTGNPNVLDWCRANLDVLLLGRCDGLSIEGKVSGFACRSLVHAIQEAAITGNPNPSANTPGGCADVSGGIFKGDECQTALWLDGLECGIVNRTWQLGSLVTNGFNGKGGFLPNARAIMMDTSGGCELQIPSLNSFYMPAESVRLSGNTNSLQIGTSRWNAHNLAVTTKATPAGTPAAPAIVVEPSVGPGFHNQCMIGSAVIINSGNSLLYDTTPGDSVRSIAQPPIYDNRPQGLMP